MFVAPAGTPLALRDIVGGLVDGLRSDQSLRSLHEELARISGTSRCWSFSSGRAAMVVALRAMHRLVDPARTQVIIPGYTCYSVAASVQNAGLEPVLCDVDPHTLSPDLTSLERLCSSRTLAVLTANLYGLPNALNEIEEVAKSRGVFMLDDAAQALGARLGARAAGGFGDAGLYSFDKGKNIPTMQGGAVVSANADFARALDQQWQSIPASAAATTFATAAKLAPYSLLLKPNRYSVVRSLPGLGLGLTRYELEYPMTRYSPALAGLAARLARRIDPINAQRIESARRYREELDGVPGLSFVSPLPSACPVYLRFPVLIENPSRRDAVIHALEAAGIGATTSYPQALCDVPEVRQRMTTPAQTPGACEVAKRIVTLPTHAYVPVGLAHRVRDILQRVLT